MFFVQIWSLIIRVVVTGCENLHENGVLRVTIMPQTRHSSKFSGHVSCPDFLDRVSVLFTASVAPCSCFSTTTKGMGKESISPLSRRLQNHFVFTPRGRTERSSCTEQRRHLLDNSQTSPPSFSWFPPNPYSLMFSLTSVMGANQSLTTPPQKKESQIISFLSVWSCMSFDISIQRISFSSLIYQR